MNPLPPWAIDAADHATAPPALGDILKGPAANWPDRDAVNDGRTGLTFGQLEDAVRAVAGWLSEQGVEPGDRVAILAEKCTLMPILPVAIWRCGGVYVPCDATSPPARLRAMLARIEPRVVIALDDRDPIYPHGQWLGREQLDAIVSVPGPSRPSAMYARDQPAYIMFTSGSTGEPKGVEITAANLLAYFRNHNEVLRFTPEARVFSVAPFHFDVSIEDTLLPLSLGAYVFQFRSLHAGPIMRAVLARERITHLIAVSTLLTIMTGDGSGITRKTLPSLEMVMTGAEVCDPAVMNVWKSSLPGTRVINAYGPTEVTIVCFSYELPRADDDRRTSYPIGRPLRGVEAKIMADGVEVDAPGRTGELWVGGEQVMRGYFDQPDETARLVVEVGGVRYYRTGDICSYDGDGNVVFEGRDDDEVKLAGRRVHLGEIRQTALGHPGVERAAVALIPRGGRDVIALIVMAAAADVIPEVESHLANLLPEYMRPALVAWSPSLSVSSTGKTDEGRLIARLREAAKSSSSGYFGLTEGGDFEPMDEETVCAMQ